MSGDGLFRREYLMSQAVPLPSPGPWTVKERRRHERPSHRVSVTWIVLDAAGRYVAECDRQADAIHIAQHGPSPEVETEVADPSPTHGAKRR